MTPQARGPMLQVEESPGVPPRAPGAVLRYVAAHEVAHLAEMNHSAAFWSHVANLYGDHRDARGWLRTNGAALHRYRFERLTPG